MATYQPRGYPQSVGLAATPPRDPNPMHLSAAGPCPAEESANCIPVKKVIELNETNPGTTFYSWDSMLVPDSRTRLQKLYKEQVWWKDVWVFVGELVRVKPTSSPSPPDYVREYRETPREVGLELTFNNKGTLARVREFPSKDRWFKVATLGSPRPTAPPVDGGRKRRKTKKTRRRQKLSRRK